MIVISHLVHHSAQRVLDSHSLAAVGESSAHERPQHAADAIDGFDRGRVVADDDVATRGNGGAHGKSVLDAIAEPPAGEVNGGRAGVIKLDVLLTVIVGAGVILQFVDDN